MSLATTEVHVAKTLSSYVTAPVNVGHLPQIDWPNGISKVLNHGAPSIDSVTPALGAAGQAVTLQGSNFGDAQETGYVSLSDGGTNWGAPGNQAAFEVESWANDQISFLLPEPSGPGGMWALQPHSSASILVVNSLGLPSAPARINLTATPTISSLSQAKAGPGDTIIVNGAYFGAQQDGGYLHFADNGINWGAPGNVAPFQLLSWSDGQISFQVPTDDPSSWAITAGTTGTVSVTNAAGLTSEPASLELTSGVRWPVAADSGVTSIGSSGNGHMQTTVTIEENGQLSGSTHTWDTSGWGFMTGFHGAAAVRLYDIRKNVLATYGAGPYGVEGGQSRVDSWAESLSPSVLDELYSISVVNFYDPQYSAAGSIWDWISAHASQIESVAQTVAAVA